MQRVAEHRDASALTPVRRREVTYWITRDRFRSGELARYVRVWLRRPTRELYADGWIYWHAARDPAAGDYTLALHGEYKLPCAWLPNVPDDERQCIRVEGRARPS